VITHVLPLPVALFDDVAHGDVEQGSIYEL
jgi:hypothetical protein